MNKSLLSLNLRATCLLAISFTALTSTTNAQTIIFTQDFDGTAAGASPGDDYLNSIMTTERTINSSLVTTVSGGFSAITNANVSSTIITPDNAGITAQGPNYWNNGIGFGAASRTGWTIGNAVASQEFTIGVIELVVSGPLTVGFRAAIGLGNNGADATIFNFNDGNNITTAGTYNLDLSSSNFTWTDSTTPFSALNNLRLIYADAEGASGVLADGVIESLTVYAAPIPEPTTDVLLFGFVVFGFILHKRRE